MDQELDLTIPTLGEPHYRSPLKLSTTPGAGISRHTPDDARILLDPSGASPELCFELAGSRELNFFPGSEAAAGIVTCGGLCPGMNNVIRSLVHLLWHAYDVRRILGFRYGFRGLNPYSPSPPLPLDEEQVRDIHRMGGTVLGSSRGGQSPDLMADSLIESGINMLFCIGGDGTMRGAQALYQEVCRRGAKIAIIGVPKTIDNDLLLNERTFGFDTAVSIATEAIKAAHVEATGAPNGVGLVRLMGRHSGFISASATLASRDVNLVLIPELPFDISGERGVLEYIRWRLARRGHCVIVVAEGAGQGYVSTGKHDPSGNIKLGDIGLFLRDTITRELADEDLTLKYIDPSYLIRAAPANAADAVFCGRLAQEAVHAAMAGKTGMLVGTWLNRFTHVPFSAITSGQKLISLDSPFWSSVLDTTGQPRTLTSRHRDPAE